MKKYLISLIIIFVGISIANAFDKEITPLYKILDNPKSFNKKKLTTIGKIDLQFEHDTLTIIPCWPIAGSKPIAIWIDVSKIDILKKGNPNHINVKVSGIFIEKDKGHFEAYPGTLILDDIEKLSEKDSSLKCKM